MKNVSKVTLKKLLVGALAVCLLAGSALASGVQKSNDVFYDNIKLSINGEIVIPKDASGNTVEPFTYKGTTYLPVRAIAEALGEDVAWDNDTQTVIIGGSSVTYLDQMGYLDHSTSGEATCASVSGDKFNHGLSLYCAWTDDNKERSTQELTYALDGNYSSFQTTLVGVGYNGGGCVIKILGDGREVLYSSPALDHSSQQIIIDLNIKGQKRLYITAVNVDKYEGKVVLNDAKL